MQWLAPHPVLLHDHNLSILKGIAYGRFRELHIEPPTPDRLDRAVRSAVRRFEDALFERVFHARSEAVAAARADGAATVVLVGLDTTCAEWAAEVARSLSDGAAAPTVILAGAPGENEDDLRKAGVGEFVHLRSDTMAVLNTLLANLEGQS